MKKIIYSLFSGLLLVCCTQNEDLVIFDPETSIAPVLGEVPSGTLIASGDAFSITYTDADYGFACSIGYDLYISASEDFEESQRVTATIADNIITLTQTNLNTAVLNIGGEADTAMEVYFMLQSSIQSNNSTSISSTTLNSNIKSSNITPYSADLTDADIYDHVVVVGSYCSWNFDTSNLQYLYNYSGDGNTFTGVIDFGENHSSNEFKLTPEASWASDWGDASTAESEASSVQLTSSDGGNIACYTTYRYYYFSFNQTSLVLTKSWGINQIGIVGLNDEWDNDIVMIYNAERVRFWADIEVASDTQFKFRADADWTLSWGGSDGVADSSADNIAVSAGSYRVYLDLNKSAYWFDADMYGQDEGYGSE